MYVCASYHSKLIYESSIVLNDVMIRVKIKSAWSKV